jgi:hypothetical protein
MSNDTAGDSGCLEGQRQPSAIRASLRSLLPPSSPPYTIKDLTPHATLDLGADDAEQRP